MLPWLENKHGIQITAPGGEAGERKDHLRRDRREDFLQRDERADTRAPMPVDDVDDPAGQAAQIPIARQGRPALSEDLPAAGTPTCFPVRPGRVPSAES